ncbi:MAG: hypothetical protein IT555_13750 [Acetobacteraceae bacterium]|nr:hypothetical protein [Acetobacteraceae bacterium]
MSPLDILAAAENAATGGLACPQSQEMLRLEVLAEAVAHVCPGAQRTFHEDYLGRAILLIDLPASGGDAVCLVVGPSGQDGFDLARMTDEEMVPLGEDLSRTALLARLRTVRA